MVQINWTFQAKEDLKSIMEFISKDSKQFAKLQILRIKYRTRIFNSQFYLGKIVPEIDKQNIRELVEGRYRIIYKIVFKNQIDILTVHHSARDLTKREIK